MSLIFFEVLLESFCATYVNIYSPSKKRHTGGTLGIYCIVWCTTLKTRFLNVFNLSCETLLQHHVPWKV